MFEEKGISIETTVIEETEQGKILEITFRGIHDHIWPHGRKIHEFLENEVRRIAPAGVIFNFADYRYEWGNEIGDPIMCACFDTKNKILRPFAIIAEGITKRRLWSLFQEGSLDRVLNFRFCVNLTEAHAFLKRAVGGLPPL